MHVEVRRDELERAELLHLLVQPPVLLGQRLAAALQELAVHLRLLQLRPGRFDYRRLISNGSMGRLNNKQMKSSGYYNKWV